MTETLADQRIDNTARFAPAAIYVYQLTVLYGHEQDLEVSLELSPFLRAARGIMMGTRLIVCYPDYPPADQKLTSTRERPWVAVFEQWLA